MLKSLLYVKIQGMDGISDLKPIIAVNLTRFRKAKGMTQAEVASALNYTDKAVSKWERGESVPDITTLKLLADLYGVTLDDLINPSAEEIKQNPIQKLITKNRLIIPFLSSAIAWLIATAVFVFLSMFSSLDKPWLSFVFAIPASIVVLLVFSAIWGHKILSAIIVSLLIWSIPLVIFLMLNALDNAWMLFLIPIPLQIMTVLWCILRMKR